MEHLKWHWILRFEYPGWYTKLNVVDERVLYLITLNSHQ